MQLHLRERPRHGDGDDQGVFFDANGMFLISYSREAMWFLHPLGAVLAWTVPSAVLQLSGAAVRTSLRRQFAGLVLAVACCTAWGGVVAAVAPMRWYSWGQADTQPQSPDTRT